MYLGQDEHLQFAKNTHTALVSREVPIGGNLGQIDLNQGLLHCLEFRDPDNSRRNPNHFAVLLVILGHILPYSASRKGIDHMQVCKWAIPWPRDSLQRGAKGLQNRDNQEDGEGYSQPVQYQVTSIHRDAQTVQHML